ncbi:hypothetical protein LQV05_000762 [Cryptococcus neoformans]|nr:hypothetical protein LQV05_000762 [Cryptococcus neoformans]
MLVSNIFALLGLASYAHANGISLAMGTRINVGVSTSITAKAPVSERNSCSSPGDFFTQLLDNPLCSSPHTRTTPSSDLICPFNWFMHKTANLSCIPQTEVAPCDCGEGYTFNEKTKKCVKNAGSCSGHQWWHQRSSSCCDNSWHTSPPKGSCPSGITCPTNWFWHKTLKKCKPLHPRAPEPDCDNWDSHKQCCGSGGSSPSQTASKGKGKRTFQVRQQQTLYPQTELDRMYCPGSLHACTVNSGSGGEWAYECVDFATELESCGGCSSTGEGQDCTQIPNAFSVGCELGSCAVYSCKSGFRLNGTECIAV